MASDGTGQVPRIINDFPQELLRLVLDQVKQNSLIDGDGNFLNALTTCRLWYRIGEELLWTDVSLDDCQLEKFVRTSHTGVVWTRSLTIKLSPLYYVHRRPACYWVAEKSAMLATFRSLIAWKALRVLPQIINTMGRLESFSFAVSAYYKVGAMDDFFLVRDDLQTILKSLPNSVGHLELDTFCYDREGGSDPEKGHLCHTLREMIPRLLNLRLRLASLCPKLIPSNNPS